MSGQTFPVTVAVRRPDGSIEQVRVGTAERRGEGFVLRLGELSIGGAPAEPPARAAAPSASAPPPPSGGMVFPPYGRSKGAPIAGASIADLEFYASGARRSLADPSKSRWHEKERQLLAAIEAEMARQGAAPRGAGGGAPAGDDAPPHTDDDFGF